MKLGDIFFAIGIIIISSLLVYVVYDDTMCRPYEIDIYKDTEINLSEVSNISENYTKLLPNNVVNTTINIKTGSKTETSYAQSSNSAVVTQKSDTKDSLVQSSKAPNNNVNKNIKTYSRDIKPSSFPGMRESREIRQNRPVNTRNNR